MIAIITGKTGNGKTAYMVNYARSLLQAGEVVYSNTKLNPEAMFSDRQYKKIFGIEKDKNELGLLSRVEGDLADKNDRANPLIKIFYWQNFSDWDFMQNGTVFCDEGIVYFNARRWESLSDTMQMRFVQHRKDKLDLILNVQHYTFIDKTLRMLCAYIANVNLIMGSAEFKKSIIPRVTQVTEIEIPTLNRCENMGIDPYDMSAEEAEKMHIKMSKHKFWIRQRIFSWYDTGKKMVESRTEPLVHTIRKCNRCDFVKISHA